MKWFYILSLSIAAILCALPIIVLRNDASRIDANSASYNMTYSGDVKSLDPATCGDEMSSMIQGNFYEGLYSYHYLKRPLEVVNQLADGMPSISEDGLTYTIPLKKNAFFHRNACFGKDPANRHQWNTRNVSANDFVLAFKRVADYHINTGLSWAFLANRIVGLDEYREKTRQYKAGDFSRYSLNIEGVTATDDHTFVLRLTAPFPQLIYVLAMHVYAPIPSEVIEYHLSTMDDGHGLRVSIPMQVRTTEIMEQPEVVGTGPYQLTDFKRKWKIVMTRNPEFREEYYPSEGEGELHRRQCVRITCGRGKTHSVYRCD
jgi:oligopeptide transport system substrate-binding protein